MPIRITAGVGAALLGLILIFAGFCSVLGAIARPFWYDEICTVIVCRLPDAKAVWDALQNAADTNPPIFYFIARLCRSIMMDDHLGYRLPSIVGLLVTISSIYLILSKRVDRLSALVGATFILCSPLATYAFEARPYALMVACISLAILAWQRIDDSKLSAFALAITLAFAVSLHYYAILVWSAFLAAEATILLHHRRFRIGVWAALMAGAVPLLFFANLLLNLRLYYGQSFWAHPSFRQLFADYSWLFNFNGYWAWILAACVVGMAAYWSLQKTELLSSAVSIEESLLTMLLLCLPVIAVTVAKVSHGGMTRRYMVPTIVGGALALGYLASKVPALVNALLLGLMLLNYSSNSVSDWKRLSGGSLYEARQGATNDVKMILDQHAASGLPIVISSGLRYLPMAYYAPAGSTRKLYAVTDPPTAVKLVGTDSVDLALLALRRYFPLRVEDYDSFVSMHREFLVVFGKEDVFDWWPARISQEGHNIQLLTESANYKVYKVVLKP